MEVFTKKMTVLEQHIDLMGHVNNAKYLEIFEEVRWDAIVSRGFDVPFIRKSQTGPVILEVNMKFLSEIRLREEISVTMEPLNYEGRVGQLRQKIIKKDGTLSCEADFVFGLFDLQARKLIAPTPEWKMAVGLPSTTLGAR